MKFPVSLLTLSVIASVNVASAQNVLFVGNSFTMGLGGQNTFLTPDGVGSVFESLSADAGFATNVEMVAFSSWDLTQHSAIGSQAMNTISSGIGGQDWDYIVLQEFSSKPTLTSVDSDIPAFQTALAALATQIETYNSDAKIVLYETWARDAAHSIYSSGQFTDPIDFQTQVSDQYDIAEAYLENTVAGFGADDVLVAHAGEAWIDVIGTPSSLGIDLYEPDNYHGSDHGYYVSALEIFETIHNTSTIGLTNVFDSISPEEAAFLQEVVSESVPEPSSALLSLLAGIGFLLRRNRK